MGKQYEVCTDAESKYRCPTCLTSYCSLGCYKKYKEAPCAKSDANGDIAAASEEVGKMLRDREPQELISRIYSSPNFRVEFEKAMEGPAFREFTDKVLRTYCGCILSCRGLNRYRQGGIFLVTGFYNSTPEVAFVCRKRVVLSVNKTDEEELQLMVEKASRELKKANTKLFEFISYSDHDSQPGHHVIFWELGSHEHSDTSVG